MDGLSCDLDGDGPGGGLLPQASGADHDVGDLGEVPLGVGAEPLDAAFAAEEVEGAGVGGAGCLLPGDPEADQRAAAGGADHGLHDGNLPSVQAAQQESWVTSRVKDWATWRRASLIVRYGAQVPARSSTVSPNLTAYTPASMRSPAPSARACTPRILPVWRSATSLTAPRVSWSTSARGHVVEPQDPAVAVVAGGDRLGLGHARGGELRVGEDHARQAGVVDGVVLAEERVAGGEAALGGGDVDELRAAGDVAGREHGGVGGALAGVDGDEVAAVEFDTGRRQAEGLDAGAASGELTRRLGLAQPKVSNHLACLRWCGFVEARREHRVVHYRLADQRVADMLELADGLLERNADHVAACCRIPVP